MLTRLQVGGDARRQEFLRWRARPVPRRSGTFGGHPPSFGSTAGGLPGNQVAARRLSNNPERALASEPESPLVHRLPAFVDLAFLEMALEKDQRIVSQHAGTPVKTNYKL